MKPLTIYDPDADAWRPAEQGDIDLPCTFVKLVAKIDIEVAKEASRRLKEPWDAGATK